MMRVLVLILASLLPFTAFSATAYEIESAVNDEKFVINGELFEAKTYCLGWEEGQRVIFIEGSALGACATAELYNLDREEKCEVWCE